MTLLSTSFLWPLALLALLLVPLLVWLYRRGLRGSATAVTMHADTALLSQAASEGERWRRHGTALLYLAACALALLALARPTLAVPEAHPKAGIILALDVSRSMQAQDISPSRFEAAREALRDFVRSLPEGTRVGLVTFAGYATQVVPLTDNHERLLSAVDLIYLNFGTAIGEALLEGVRALPSLEQRRSYGEDPSSFGTIILLSDGRNYGGIDPLQALNIVKDQEITVHTVGVGSVTSGYIPGIPERYQAASRFDERTLRLIAEQTGGRYVFADSASSLREVYRDLSRSLVWRIRQEEASALASLGAALVLCLSLSVARLRRQVA